MRIGILLTILFVILAVMLWFCFYGYDLYSNKISHGTYTGKLEPFTLVHPLVFIDSDGEQVPLSHFSGQYLVLDFWSTSCGLCYEKFPKVQEIFDKYKEKPQVSIYAVHCRVEDKENYSKGVDLIREQKKQYTFPCLSIDMKDPVRAEIGVNVFPTVIVVDPNGKIVCRASIEVATKFIDKLI